MSYTCYAESGAFVSGSIDLSKCISNQNGYLKHSGRLAYPTTALNAVVMRYILKDTLFLVDIRTLATHAQQKGAI